MPLYQKFEENENGRDFAVGDIHGAFTELEAELEKVGFEEEIDRLFSVGDLIDRGKESERSIEFLEKPWFHACMGNHEQMLCNWHTQEFVNTMWLWQETDTQIRVNGSAWALGIDLQPYYNLMHDLPLIIEIEREEGNVGLVHADPREVSRDWDVIKSQLMNQEDSLKFRDSRMTCASLMWGRSTRERLMGKTKDTSGAYEGHPYDNFDTSKLTKEDHEWFSINGIKEVYVGHTPSMQGVLKTGNINHIDTGSPHVYVGGKVTVVQI